MSPGVRRFPVLGGAIVALAWSPDGRRLADGRLGPVIRVWDVADGAVIRTWDESSSRRKPCRASLAFAPDGVLFARIDRQVVYWGERGRERLFGHTGRARADGFDRLQMSADGRVLLTADGHGMDLRTRARLARPQPPAWVVDDIRLSATALAPDGQTCAVAWDVDDRRQHTLALAIIDAHSGALLAWPTQGELPACDELWFSPDGHRLLAIGHRPSQGTRQVSVFGADGGSRFELAIPVDAAGEGPRDLAVRTGAVALAPDGERLLNAAGATLEIVSLGTAARAAGGSIVRIGLPIGDVSCLAVSPDGRAVALGNARGDLAVMDLPASGGRFDPCGSTPPR